MEQGRRAERRQGNGEPMTRTVRGRKPDNGRRMGRWVGIVASLLVVGSGVVWGIVAWKGSRRAETVRERPDATRDNLNPRDIAVMNLRCAQELPGAEGLDVDACLATLDQWAVRVKTETERHLHRFRSNPTEYEHSEGYFRALMMAVIVYEDFGVRYNPERIALPSADAVQDRFFADSRDIFLHGLLAGRRMGTCSSMPVLYVALGRRLGYPLKLVATKAHLFIRWEDGRERFNLEATGKGMNRYDDAHFKQWPFPVTEDECRAEGYLKSLIPAEELAVFLSLRGNCLKEAGEVAEAAEAYAAAVQVAPGWNAYRALLASVQNVGVDPRLISDPTARMRMLPTTGHGPAVAGPDPNPLKQIH